jgi:hypothetical protein
VIVTPAIETAGERCAVRLPTVTTGPPPLTIVAAAPAPISLTLFSILTPPSNVPASTVIVSPSCAASSPA